MRLTSAMWFAVFMRRETERGAYVSVVNSGAQQAGAIFVIHNHLDNFVSLYAPAPQAVAVIEDDDDRSFEMIFERESQDVIDAYLEKQKKFDPDLWIIETESASGVPSLRIISE